MALTSIAILAGVTLFLLDLDFGHTSHEEESAYPASAIVAALRSAYEAGDGWAEADLSPAIALAHLEGAGLTVEAGDHVVLRVAPGPRGGAVAQLPVVVGGRQVATALVTRPSSGLLPPEVALRHELVDGIAISALVAAVLAVSAALLASRRLVAPLYRLTVAVTRYGAGDRSSRAGGGVARPDEIGELARAFDKMASDLQREDHLRRALVADVAHELRTPLAILRAQIDAVSIGIDDFSEATLGSLSEEVDRLARFVDDLGVLAAAEAAGLRLEHSLVDLAQVAEAASARLAARFGESGTALTLDLKAAPVLGDHGRLEQVAVNLLTNAEKFSPAGGNVHLRVSREGSEAVLAVSDDGPGVPVDEQERVFERFYRGSTATQGRATGSGVGLAVVSEIVAAHGGTVELKSAAGRGEHLRCPAPRHHLKPRTVPAHLHIGSTVVPQPCGPVLA